MLQQSVFKVIDGIAQVAQLVVESSTFILVLIQIGEFGSIADRLLATLVGVPGKCCSVHLQLLPKRFVIDLQIFEFLVELLH